MIAHRELDWIWEFTFQAPLKC